MRGYESAIRTSWQSREQRPGLEAGCPPVRDCGHGVHASRPDRPAGLPAVPRHDELRPADRRARQPRDHGRRARRRHQLLRHRERLRLGRNAAGPRRSSARWFASGGGRRERTVLATKLYGDMGDWPNDGRLSALNIRRALRREPEAAADRLHRPLPDAPHRPGHAVGRDLAGDGGRCRRRARSSTSAAATSPAGTSPRRRPRPPSATSSGWSASSRSTTCSTRDVELEVLPAAEHYGLGVIPWSPLHGGLLGGVLARRPRACAGSTAGRRRAREAPRARSRGTRSCAPSWARSPADVGLAWLLHQPAVTAPIIGPRTLTSSTAPLRPPSSGSTQEALDRLDELFPGHKTAPEDYAW